MRSSLLAILLICAALTACTKRRVITSATPSASANTLVEGTVIKTTGSWTHSERGAYNSLTVTVSGKAVGWKHEASGTPSLGGSISSTSWSSTALPWFIYVEAPDSFWLFDGSGNLSYRRFNPDDLRAIMTDGTLRTNVADIPPGLVPHLPAELQKLFPAVDTKKPRPSI